MSACGSDDSLSSAVEEGMTRGCARSEEDALNSALGNQGRLQGEGSNLAEPSRRVFHVGKWKEVFESGERVFLKARKNDNVGRVCSGKFKEFRVPRPSW